LNPTKYEGGSITWRELAKHNTLQDCWVCVSGKVFDVTNYMQFHPGGRKLMLGAGRDATQLFFKYHSWVNIDSIMSKSYLGMVSGPPLY